MNPAPTQKPTRRRPPFPWFGTAQVWLLVSLLAVLIGSMLPWWDTVVGRVYGLENYGMFTLWAAAVGLSGTLSVRRSLYDWLPGIGSIIALGLVIWMLTQGASECAVEEGSLCRPLYGLIVTGAGALNGTVLSVRTRLGSRTVD
jgi:hypothetical protein